MSTPLGSRATKKQPSWLERLLGLVSEVRSGEGLTVVLMTLNVFLILAAYYIIKTLRESEILSRGMLGLRGSELKAYANAGQAVLLLGVIPIYGWIASQVGRIKLINMSVLFFMFCLGLFFLLAGPLELSIGLAYYLWVGIFSVFVIAQFWSFANDIYTKEQGKRLFPIVAVGGSVGAIVGPYIAKMVKQHPYELMLASAGVLGVCLLLYNVVHRGHAAQVRGRADIKVDQPLSKDGGFQLVLRQRYLLLIALMLTLGNFINTTGGYLLDRSVETQARTQVPDSSFADIDNPIERAKTIKKARGAVISELYGGFYSWVNLLSLLVQAFLVSRIFKYLGVRTALFFLPFIALGGYLLILAMPVVSVVRAAKLAENSTDYSLQNTVRQALFLPTSREAKYKAKAAIDTFFFRFGDTAAALLIFAGIHWLSFQVRDYAAACLVAAVLGLVTVMLLAREHRKLVPDDRNVEGVL